MASSSTTSIARASRCIWRRRGSTSRSTQIFELTDPQNPRFVSAWGPELLCEEDVFRDDPYNATDPDVLAAHMNE